MAIRQIRPIRMLPSLNLVQTCRGKALFVLRVVGESWAILYMSCKGMRKHPFRSFWKRMGVLGGRGNLFAEKGFPFPLTTLPFFYVRAYFRILDTAFELYYSISWRKNCSTEVHSSN